MAPGCLAGCKGAHEDEQQSSQPGQGALANAAGGGRGESQYEALDRDLCPLDW